MIRLVALLALVAGPYAASSLLGGRGAMAGLAAGELTHAPLALCFAASWVWMVWLSVPAGVGWAVSKLAARGGVE